MYYNIWNKLQKNQTFGTIKNEVKEKILKQIENIQKIDVQEDSSQSQDYSETSLSNSRADRSLLAVKHMKKMVHECN